MSHYNSLTTKRHQEDLAKIIFEVMQNNNVSLLHAYSIVAQMVSSDIVTDKVKAKVDKYNGVQE